MNPKPRRSRILLGVTALTAGASALIIGCSTEAGGGANPYVEPLDDAGGDSASTSETDAGNDGGDDAALR